MTTKPEYSTFSIDDFIKDEYFQQWVLSTNGLNRAFWDDFILNHPEKELAIREARFYIQVLNSREGEILDFKVTALKKRIDLAIDSEELDTSVHQPEPYIATPVKTARYKNYYGIAAGICLIALLTYLLILNRTKPEILPTFSSEIMTKKGQRSLLTLSDGTKVWLNADSYLKYPDSFNGMKIREVFLEGEAFFDVVENIRQPFLVRTSGIQVKVLGTAFNIRSYEKDNTIETILVRGKVTIETDSKLDGITLSPNQKAVFEKQSGKLLLDNQIDTEKFTSWREGKMFFEDQPFSEIVTALERWYNVSIQVEDSGSIDCRFSAKIDNKTLVEVLELFKASENIDYKMEGNKISITGKLCAD